MGVSGWPQAPSCVPLERQTRETDRTHGEDGAERHGVIARDTGVWVPVAGRRRKGCSQSLQREHGCGQHLHFRLVASGTEGEGIPFLLNHLARSDLFRKP